MSSAQVILVNDVPYVVDCANAVARQLVSAGVALAKIRHVFVTHHHSDHNADYGTLLLLAWASGLRTQVDTWGRRRWKRSRGSSSR
jgi:ribonuclease BN (tRNA processing enzyme)